MGPEIFAWICGGGMVIGEISRTGRAEQDKRGAAGRRRLRLHGHTAELNQAARDAGGRDLGARRAAATPVGTIGPETPSSAPSRSSRPSSRSRSNGPGSESFAVFTAVKPKR